MEKELSLKKIKIETKKSNLTKEKGITPVNIRIAVPGKNRNGFNIPKNVLEDAVKETMGLTPIIGLFDKRKEDFGDHGKQMTTNERGDYYVDEPRAIGVIPENFEMTYDDKGYLCVNGYLWTGRYPDAKKAIGKGQSMELNPQMTKFGETKNGFTTILKTGFLALTVLGDKVEPCFKDAKIESGEQALVFALDNIKNRMKEETKELVKELEFALNPQEDIMIDIDAEEKDKINREKITEAIDELEDILDELDEESAEKAEKALKNLVSAETDMKSEPKLVILDEDAKEALRGENEGDENIVEKENVNFAEDKKKKEEKPFVEEETKETKDGEEEIKTTEKTGDKSETITEDKKAPAVKEGDKSVKPKDGIVEKSVEESEPEKTKGVQEGAADIKTPQKEPVSLDNTEKANEVAKQRADVATMRLDEMLKGVSNTDVMKFLIDRMGEVSEFQTAMQAVMNTVMPMNNAPSDKIEETELDKTNVPKPKEVEVKEEEMGTEPTMEEKEVVDEETPVEDKNAEVEETEVPTEEKEEVEPMKEEIVEKEVPAKDKPVEEKEIVKEETQPETEEEKRKKLKSLNHSLMMENSDLMKELKEIKEQNKELLEFKLAVEKEQKEELLNQFNLSEKAKDEIRKDFATLTFSEIEDKAVLAQYHEAKNNMTVETKKEDIVFSENNQQDLEFSINSDSTEDEISSVLDVIRKRSEEDMKIEL